MFGVLAELLKYLRFLLFGMSGGFYKRIYRVGEDLEVFSEIDRDNANHVLGGI